MQGNPGKNWEQIARNSSEDVLIKMFQSTTMPIEAIYAAGAELTRRQEIRPCTNLDKWWQEMKAGTRDAYTFDDLWRKACEEYSTGLPAGSRHFRRSNLALWEPKSEDKP